jgi:N-acetylglucosamine-6-phosphate deacetylase
MAGQTAAELMGLKSASLKRGDRADFILFSESQRGGIEIAATVVAGAIRYSRM